MSPLVRFARHLALFYSIIYKIFTTMKQFMMLFFGPYYHELNMTPEETQQMMQKWFDWVDKLKAKDLYIAGDPLTPDAKTVRGKNPVVTDGPFAETKELVGGYFIIKANSLEQAAELAKDCPDLTLGGTVEVREIMLM